MHTRVCPRCRSRDIEAAAPFIWFGERIYKCRKCGFSSPIFPEDSYTPKRRRRK